MPHSRKAKNIRMDPILIKITLKPIREEIDINKVSEKPMRAANIFGALSISIGFKFKDFTNCWETQLRGLKRTFVKALKEKSTAR